MLFSFYNYFQKPSNIIQCSTLLNLEQENAVNGKGSKIFQIQLLKFQSVCVINFEYYYCL